MTSFSQKRGSDKIFYFHIYEKFQTKKKWTRHDMCILNVFNHIVTCKKNYMKILMGAIITTIVGESSFIFSFVS
jgi:hypothetical protein